MRFKPMDEFPEDFQSFEPSLPLLEMDSSMGLVLENPSFNLQSLMDFSDDGFFLQQPDLPISLSSHNLSSFSFSDLSNSELHPQFVASLGDRNQESEMMESSKRNSEMSPTLVSEIRPKEGEKISRKNSSGRRKRGRCHEKQVEKPEEVIHVRARRGQATDSHSVAERARREKINERLRKLQDLVPGCYKMMGMTAMLDEIIRYVQSLQNQIEFLSMKLSAADSFHNFCTETEAIEIRATDEFKGQMWSGW